MIFPPVLEALSEQSSKITLASMNLLAIAKEGKWDHDEMRMVIKQITTANYQIAKILHDAAKGVAPTRESTHQLSNQIH